MARVLLLNQFYSVRKEAPEFIQAALPINLLYLGTYLRERGVDCKILELGVFDRSLAHVAGNRFRCGLRDEQIRAMLKAENPSVVGIGCMFTRHFLDVMAIAALVKEAVPSARVVLGGNHATNFPEAILHNPNVDYVVMGEGEVTFYEVCRHVLDGGRDARAIRGLVYRDEAGAMVRTEPRELVEDLDTLSVDYSLVDVPQYAAMSRLSPFLMRYPSLAITTSRGCPNRCVYCTVRAVYGRTWRGRSAKKTVDDLQLLHEKYGIREFSILDDSASVNKVRWNEICDEIIRRKLDIRWMTPNGIAHWTLDEATLDKMKKAGCYRITFGIESGNPETRKYLGKPFPLEQAKALLQHAGRIGMWTISTNILGFPYETREQMEDTLRFNQRSGTDFATFFLLEPHVTSEVYQDFRKEGLLNFDPLFSGHPVTDEEFDRMIRIINDGGASTRFFQGAELKEIQMRFYRRFVMRRTILYLVAPWQLLRKIRSWEDFRYLVRLLMVGAKIFAGTFGRKTTKKLLYSDLATE